jgi:hypothetical protein
MKFDLLSSAGREIAQWRQFFRVRGSAAARKSLRPDPLDSESNPAETEWSDTEWSETCPDTLMLSGPIESTETPS